MNKLRGQLLEERRLWRYFSVSDSCRILSSSSSSAFCRLQSISRHPSAHTHALAVMSSLTCPAPPAPDRTAPWRCAAARQSWTPRRCVPTAATRSRRCRTAGSSWSSPKGRRRGAGWGPPRPPGLCRPARWTETPGWP